MTKSYTEHPDQAWQVVLDQLEIEMPRATFETWVRDTKALSYRQGHITIGAGNAYACEWLKSRLASQASRLLIGVMGEMVTVEFVVSEIDFGADEDDEDEIENAENTGGYEIELTNATRYEEEVKPHKVVVIPGYALRLLAQGDLSAKEMSLWLAFRQAAYFDWKKAGGKASVFARNIPYQDVISFAGMSRASYFRAINGKDQLVGGMVLRLPEAYQPGFNPHLDNAIRWQVAMSPRLTRHDAAVIETILQSDIALADATQSTRHEAALRSLQDMLQRSPADYLDMPFSTPKHAPAGVVEILRRSLGLEEDIPAALFEAAEGLQDRIMHAYGTVHVTHHFLKEVVPALGLTQSQMWTVIVLRDRFYYDYENGVEHDFVMASRGLDSLASWTGVSTKSLSRWLEQPEFRILVHLSQVEIPENDLSEGADRLRSWMSAGGQIFSVCKAEPPVGYLADNESGQMIPVWTKRAMALDKVSNGSGQSEHRVETKRAPGLDKVSNGSGQSEHPLNNLYKPLLNPSKPLNPHPTRAAHSRKTAGGGLGSNSAYWDFDFLMQSNAVNPGTVQNFRKQLKDGLPIAKLSNLFVSWLLYAHSPLAGDVLDPVSIAISRIKQNPHAGMPAFDHLATLRPYELKTFFDADLSGEQIDTDSPNAALYRQHLGPLNANRKQQLYSRLFGE